MKKKISTDPKTGRVRVQTINDMPSKTSQQFKDQCDINLIMKKFANTGQLTHVRRNPGIYTDLSNVPTYHEALNTVIAARDAFMTLPSEVRKRFGNDPQEMMNFLNDPKNKEEAIKLNLINTPIPPVVPQPQPTPQPTPQKQNPKTKNNPPTQPNLPLDDE